MSKEKAVPTTVLRADSDQIVQCWTEASKAAEDEGELWFVIRKAKFTGDSNDTQVGYIRLNKEASHKLLQALISSGVDKV